MIYIQVEFDDETGHPTDRLNAMALATCKSVGSSAKTVSDILKDDGDERVLRMIQKGMDNVNRRAACKVHKVGCSLVWTGALLADHHTHNCFLLNTSSTDSKMVDSPERFLNTYWRNE